MKTNPIERVDEKIETLEDEIVDDVKKSLGLIKDKIMEECKRTEEIKKYNVDCVNKFYNDM